MFERQLVGSSAYIMQQWEGGIGIALILLAVAYLLFWRKP